MNKKELHFWQLSFIFIFIIISTLLYNWGYKEDKQSNMVMMSQSMGNMMSSMDLKNITLGNLLSEATNSKKNEDMSSHHSGVENHIKYIYNVSTVVIVLLLPFIIGGTIFLSIIWIKK